MIIDSSYFDNSEYSITNLNSVGVKDKIDYFVAKYELDFVENALGFSKAQEYLSFFEPNGDLSPTTPQEWVDLTNGLIYTKDNIEKKWEGLRLTIGDKKSSMIAMYVYYYVLENSISYSSSVGEQKPKAENSLSVVTYPKMVKIWNQFIKKYQGFERCQPIIRHFHHGFSYDYYGNNKNIVSLQTYLHDFKEFYGDKFTMLDGYKNRVDL